MTKRLIVVLGMHRSGTSAITRGLNVLGVELGDRLMPPAEGNNGEGFFEDIDLNALNIEMLQSLGSDWHYLTPIEPGDVDGLHKKDFFLRAVDLLRQKTADVSCFGFKDPRVAKLLPFWREVFVYCGLDMEYVLVIRNPLSVAQSLAKRDGFSSEKSYMLWLGHVITSLSHTEERRRVLVDYDHFLHSPKKGLELIAERLALPIDAQAFQQYQSDFLDKELRHTIYELTDVALDQTCPPLVQELYATLIDVSRDNKQLDNPAFYARTAVWANEFNRLKSNLRWIDKLSVPISSLKESINVHDEEIIGLIKAALEQNQDFFQTSFDATWYLKKYPDIAAAGVDPYLHYISSGIPEGRLPAADLVAFVRSAFLDRSKELNAQFNQIKLLAETQLRQLGEREKAFTQQLQEIQQAHELQKGEQSREHAEREQAYLAQLTQARQQIESQLLRLAEREKAFTQQLQEIQQAHEQQKDEQSREHAEREQAYLAQLTQARQQIETQLLRLAEREKAFAQQLQEMHQTHEQQKGEQSREHAERERILNARLRAKQDELDKLTYHWEEGKKAHGMALSQLHGELNAMRTTLSWRWTSPLRSLGTLLFGKKDSGFNPPAIVDPIDDKITSLDVQPIEITPSMRAPSRVEKKDF